MKIFICSNENQLLGAKVAKNAIIQRSKYSEDDVQIILESSVSQLNYFFAKPYLRNGRMIMFDKYDMQSFTLLRFYIPELMGYRGTALVIDPDIFLIKSGLEELENFSFDSSPIYARKGLQKNSWGSSVMLLSCENLKHWSLKLFVEQLHDGHIDYDDLINLRLERSVAPLETKWNEFDDIKPETLLLHTTEKLTQPWRAGLRLNSSIPPLFKFIPRAPIYKIFGKDLTTGREHPSPEVTQFFFKELSQCIADNIISNDEIDLGIKKKFLRQDLREKLKKF
jgi:hypothetical protein